MKTKRNEIARKFLLLEIVKNLIEVRNGKCLRNKLEGKKNVEKKM